MPSIPTFTRANANNSFQRIDLQSQKRFTNCNHHRCKCIPERENGTRVPRNEKEMSKTRRVEKTGEKLVRRKKCAAVDAPSKLWVYKNARARKGHNTNGKTERETKTAHCCTPPVGQEADRASGSVMARKGEIARGTHTRIYTYAHARAFVYVGK